MRHKRRKLQLVMGLLLTTAITVTQFQPAYASKKSEAESRKAEYESMKESLEAEQEGLQEQRTALQQYTWEIDEKLTDSSTKIYELKTQISEKQKEIDATQKKLEESEVSIAQQYEDMKLRIQFMYEKGNSQFMSMLLSADSISDFLNKAEYVSQITDYDRKMLDKLEETKNNIETAKAELVAGKEKLVNLKKDQEERQAELEKLLAEKEKELEKTDSKISKTADSIYSVASQIQTEEDNLAEIERIEQQRREAEAQRAREESISAFIAAQQGGSSNSGGTTVQYDHINTDEGSYSGNGSYIWPLPSQYRTRSSTFGYRNDPWGSGSTVYHCGDDYPAPAGTPIYAVADGTVDSSGYSSSTGNCVVLYHGNGLSSIYMHASVLLVSAGQTVKQGDVIALVGTTGPSTGNHLHISFRLNGNWVDPKNYIGG